MENERKKKFPTTVEEDMFSDGGDETNAMLALLMTLRMKIVMKKTMLMMKMVMMVMMVFYQAPLVFLPPPQ